ncbi:hypothetical protein Q8A72_06985 [Aeribacillus pallidus]|nr:hypothetical protein [Aeribacillus pallidus]
MRVLVATLRDGRVFKFFATEPIECYLARVKTDLFLYSDDLAIRCSEITSLEIISLDDENDD